MKRLTLNIDVAGGLPIYEQIRNQIGAFIADNAQVAGTPLPDIRSLAKMAGVSVRTVERALDSLIRDGICYRRPKKGTFVGAGPRTVARRVCALCHAQGLVSFERDLIQAAIYRGIREQSQRRKLDSVFLNGRAREDIAFYHQAHGMDFRGVIMLHWENLGEALELTRAFPGLRFVFLNYFLPGFEQTPGNLYGIFDDDFAGGYQVADHLARRGHRQVAVCTADQPNYVERVRGFRKGWRDAGRTTTRCGVQTGARAAGEDWRDVGRRLAERIFRARPRTDAIFCVNDILATGVTTWLNETGRRDDVEVFGYDNAIPTLSRDNRFGTVAVDFEGIGAKAIELLSEAPGDFPKILRLTPTLLIRNTEATGAHA